MTLALKQRFRQALLDELEARAAQLDRAVHSAREAATHEEAVAEDKYDTRGLEASYLAGAQEARLRELRSVIALYRALPAKVTEDGDEIAPLALVDLEDQGGERRRVFLGPQGGGVTVPFEGEQVLVVTPVAPLGEALLAKCEGDEVVVGGKTWTITRAA
jgi:transcription elongation GreA/GreB family factor